MAGKSGAYVVEINTRATAISSEVDMVIEGKSGEILKQLADTIKTIRTNKTS